MTNEEYISDNSTDNTVSHTFHTWLDTNYDYVESINRYESKHGVEQLFTFREVYGMWLKLERE